MELEPIGDIEGGIDIDPITIPVVAWSLTTGKKAIEKFEFRPTLPYGASFALYDSVDGKGDPRPGRVVNYICKCLMPADLERWKAFLDSDELMVEQDTISTVFTTLTEIYSARPTLPRSSSSPTGKPTKATSPAASRARASRSRKSPSQSRST
jgi:hypothetical protein